MTSSSDHPSCRATKSRAVLLHLATADDCSIPGGEQPTISAPAGPCCLDQRTRALVRLGALIALGAGPGTYRRTVEAARAAGASDDDVIDALLSIAPTVGMARIVAATAAVTLALGYDIDTDLEGPFTTS